MARGVALGRCSLLFTALAGLVACADIPVATFGTESPTTGGGVTEPVSTTFRRAELHALYSRLTSAEFQSQLIPFNCGDPVPALAFTVSLWRQGKYQERTVLVQTRPYLPSDNRYRCLTAAIGYLLEFEIPRLDRGLDYIDSRTGKPLPTGPPPPGRAPICDCSKRDSGGEWVTWPFTYPKPAS